MHLAQGTTILHGNHIQTVLYGLHLNRKNLQDEKQPTLRRNAMIDRTGITFLLLLVPIVIGLLAWAFRVWPEE